MARGLLSGLIWGSVIATGGVAVLSAVNPMRSAPVVTTADPQEPASAQGNEAAPAPQVATSSQTGSAQPGSPDAPSTDSLAAMQQADTTPAQAPLVGDVAVLSQAADPETEAPGLPAAEESSRSVVQAPAPVAPDAAEQVTISTEPAQPAPPPTAEEGSGFANSEDGTAPETEVAPEAEVATQAAEAEAATAQVETQPAELSEPSDPAAPQADQTMPRIAALPNVTSETSDGAAQSGGATLAPSPRIGQPAISLTERNATGSLPSIGAAPAADADAEVTEQADTSALTPFEQFAAPFTNPDAKPLMGIVLVDGAGSIGAEALSSFPYPLTFAVDPDDPQAADKMARYRAAGFEVLALMDLPLAASAQDAETALEVGLTALPEVIGVMEGLDSGVQGNRGLSDQVTAILRDKGYAFVTQNSGLNTVQKLAARDGVPSAFVFRDFDGAGQTPTVMRRFLDQAAFRAGQEGGVIMMGRVQPDTISALLLWGLQDRASRVALAPVSAVLMAAPVEQ